MEFTPKQWIAIITDIVVAIPILIGIFYLIYIILRGKDINSVLLRNPKHIFETIIVLAVLLEVMSLSILGLERNISLSACLSRYGLAGALEIFLSFLTSTAVARAVIDKKITQVEVIEIGVLFLLSIGVTTLIYLFYLEANGNLNFIGLFEYNNTKVKKVELGAVFIIWVSVPLNLLNIVFQIKQMKEEQRVVEALKKATNKEDKKKEDKEEKKDEKKEDKKDEKEKK